jgi:hypothetical protein
VLETTGHIEHIANAERDPPILAKSLDLSRNHVKGLPFTVAVKRHNHTGGNGALDQAIIVVVF